MGLIFSQAGRGEHVSRRKRLSPFVIFNDTSSNWGRVKKTSLPFSPEGNIFAIPYSTAMSCEILKCDLIPAIEPESLVRMRLRIKPAMTLKDEVPNRVQNDAEGKDSIYGQARDNVRKGKCFIDTFKGNRIKKS